MGDSMRYCPKCSTEVEDTGGYCLLGHRLALDPPTSSLSQLRDEVDRSFENSDLDVTAVLAAVGAPTTERTLEEVPTSPMRTVPPRRAASPPPPPPPPVTRKPTPWEELENEVDIAGDPIAAFAPAPRMDWGPQRSKLFRGRSAKATPKEDA